ncbi:unnamed protein product [Clavelina lepadiformis]|uniref:Uncharacterized protein n=1 Tax=Clavelina lepadiformis TaxID=159417 RepID=A0ABP0G8C7_CLALP
MDLGDLETKEDQLEEIFGDVMEVNIGSFDPLQAITKKMMKIWNVGNKEEKFEIDFNVYILLLSVANGESPQMKIPTPKMNNGLGGDFGPRRPSKTGDASTNFVPESSEPPATLLGKSPPWICHLQTQKCRKCF